CALESDGIVTREVAGEWEVWNRLTPKGQALEPVFDALLVWGMDHALGPPRGGKRFIRGGRWTRSCHTSRTAGAPRERARSLTTWAPLRGRHRACRAHSRETRRSRSRATAA